MTYLDGREKRKRRRSVGRIEDPGREPEKELGDGRELRPSRCLLDSGES